MILFQLESKAGVVLPFFDLQESGRFSNYDSLDFYSRMTVAWIRSERLFFMEKFLY